MELLRNIGTFVGGILISIGSFFAPSVIQQPYYPPIEHVQLGSNATNPLAGTVYTLSGSGIAASASSIVLTSLTIPQTGYLILGTDLSTTFYITLEPGSRTRQEIASCTGVTQNAGGTATLSGCSRGLLPFSPYTASSTYQFPHGGGTQVIFSNPPQLYSEFAATGNSTTITGAWTYSSSSIPKLGADTTYAQNTASNFNLVDYGTLASTSIAGAVPASVSNAGIVRVATQAQLAAGTTGIGYELVPVSEQFTSASIPSVTYEVPVAVSGTLATAFINQGASTTYSFLGNTTLASTTITNLRSATFSTATSTATSTDVLNLLPAGVIQMYASSSAPAGWLLADGTSYATSSYPRLFNVIGYTYGGSTSTFGVPNIGGRFVAGPSSTLSSTLGATGGATSTVSGPYSLAAGIGVGDANPQVSTAATNSSTLPIIPPYIILQYIIKY